MDYRTEDARRVFFGNDHSKVDVALDTVDQIEQNIDKIGSINNLLDDDKYALLELR